ncbi:uncharacterized protein I206_101035 [Kwoniella pini CBS 10737]|uniref:N-acetyltransferase 9-like protein n=1 Tax=Kwoniella pini CBS 10737 TaxID=1296096 RepID=A0A1B9IC87_9TREE|nr:uncharacterized protein I206_00291 [Kwoniella pini CBS 10737]OCF52990.1 hypothetical protein I206_00291 [Kwoniella pini CBS 10737]
MRLNENTVIFGDRVILVPYRVEHVSTYHEWMKSPELLELTASEPLTLEEELEMQCKWHLDEDKLTFIILARKEINNSLLNKNLTLEEIKKCKMIGDVNLFLPDGIKGKGECEIMIASKEDRRKGYAREAIQLFLKYLIQNLSFKPLNLVVKIGLKNIPSIKLFQSLGFGIIKFIKVFNEIELNYGKEDDFEILNELGLSKIDYSLKLNWENLNLNERIGTI